MTLSKVQLTLGCLLAFSIALSTVHPFGNPRLENQADDLLAGSDAPQAVRAILETKCGNCHSAKTQYPLYTRIAPVTWLVDHDVIAGREQVDLSRWQLYSDEQRISALTRIASEVHAGEMPPRLYTLVHPSAQLSGLEQQIIYEWAKFERKQLRRPPVPSSGRSSADARSEKP